MGILKACIKNAFESWPVVKAGFQGTVDSPWKETIEWAGRKLDEVTQPFQLMLAPDVFFKSEAGRALVPGLLRSDQNGKLMVAKFIEDNKDFLQVIDPVWEGAQEGVYKKEVADQFSAYMRGNTKTKDLPTEFRNSAAKVKQWVVDTYNETESFQNLKPRSKDGTMFDLWHLEEDVIEPTRKVLFDPNNPHFGMHGLTTMVPKEIPFKIIEKGSTRDVSGVDWLRAAVPMVTRKNQFDPVIKDLREAIPKLSGLEGRYTDSLIRRLVGKKSAVNQTVDDMINTVSFATTGKELSISPSAKAATGIQKRFFDGIMLYNPGMAFLNLTQTLNTMGKEGLLPTLKGLAQFASKDGRFLASEKTFLGDMDKFYFRSADAGKLRQGLEKFEHVGYKLFNSAENFNRGLAFHVGLSRFMQENGVRTLEDFMAMRGTPAFREGMLAGMGAANETQFLYGVVNQSPYLTTPFAKLLGGQFLSFPLRQTEFMMKQLRQGNYLFFPRYMAYTGIASYAAYAGAGLAIGDQFGGAGAVPMAMDLLKEGRTSDAIYAASYGALKGTIGKFFVEGQSLKRGLTPFGGLLADTIALGMEGDPEQKWAQFGRSFSLLGPAMLETRRLIEGGLTQYVQEGERHKPAGLAQGLSIPTALSAAAKALFDQPIPGIEPRFTGALSANEEGVETLAKSFGFRTKEAEMADRVRSLNAQENVEIKGSMTELARGIAEALLTGTPEQFTQALEAATSSGVFVSEQSLNASIEAAMQRQLLTDKERQDKRAPQAAKLLRQMR